MNIMVSNIHYGSNCLSEVNKKRCNYLPLIANPLNPTAIVKNAIATAADFEKATTSKKIASKPKPKIKQ